MRRPGLTGSLAAALAAFGIASFAPAQSGESKSPAASTIVTVAPSFETHSAGGAVLKLQATLLPGWHVNSHKPSEDYLIATVARLEPIAGVTFGEAHYPAGIQKKFGFSEAPLSVYEKTFAIEVPILWDASRPPAAISGKLEYQACDSKICFIPTSVPVRWQLQVLPLDRQRAPDAIQHK